MSNSHHNVSSQYQKRRSPSKILRDASYFQLSSRCLICDETLFLVLGILPVHHHLLGRAELPTLLNRRLKDTFKVKCKLRPTNICDILWHVTLHIN